jgi:hypothetical protein
MPENSTGQIAIYQDLSAVAKFTFSPQLTGVRLSKIPTGTSLVPAGTQAVLPFEPSDGDNYSLEDVDGSCGIDNAMVVFPDPKGTATVGGIGAFPFFQPFAGAKFTFDSAANNWVVALTGNSAFTGIFSKLSGGNGLSPGDLTAGTTSPINLFAHEFASKGGGLFALDFVLTFTLSAADTVTIALLGLTDITAFSGGSLSNGTAGSLRFETGGSPLVVTATSVAFSGWAKQVAAGEIAKQTATWVGTLSVTVVPSPNPLGVLATIKTASGAQVTAMSLSTSLRQVS